MTILVFKGRKINKILCLSFLLITLIFLVAVGIFALLKRSEVCRVLFILALIMGAFSLFYGTFWYIWARKEKKTEQALNETLGRQYAPEDPARADYQDFSLPKTSLIEAARKRFLSIIRWTGIAVVGAFLLICGIQLACDSIGSPLQLLYTLLFCVLITIPGILIQFFLFRKYCRSVPSRIRLFPGKLIVDELNYSAVEIREIRVSPDRMMNPNSPDNFREMLIRTEKHSAKFRIDYRSGSTSNEQPFWEEYELFIAALSGWGAENNVPVIISYMS